MPHSIRVWYLSRDSTSIKQELKTETEDQIVKDLLHEAYHIRAIEEGKSLDGAWNMREEFMAALYPGEEEFRESELKSGGGK